MFSWTAGRCLCVGLELNMILLLLPLFFEVKTCPQILRVHAALPLPYQINLGRQMTVAMHNKVIIFECQM